MKKGDVIKSMLAIVLMAVLSVGFIACSNDDDSGSGVVGTWSGRDGSETLTLSFKSGGTGSWTLVYRDSYYGTETEKGSFTYEMDGDDQGIISIRDYDSYSGGYYSTYLYFEIDGKTMYLYDSDYEEWVLTKQ